MQVQDAVARIAEIDGLIDANRAAVSLRLHALPETSWGWQNAWNRCPDLDAREHELFRSRGFAQLERDAAEHKAYLAEQRRERAHKAAATRLERDMRAAGFARVA